MLLGVSDSDVFICQLLGIDQHYLILAIIHSLDSTFQKALFGGNLAI